MKRIDEILSAYAVILDSISLFYKSKKEILDSLIQSDLILSQRTLERYLGELSNKGFEFNLRKEGNKRLYKWDKKTGDITFLQLIQQSYLKLHFTSSDGKVVLFDFTNKTGFYKISFLKEIHKAIITQKAILLAYKKYHSKVIEQVEASPYLLKQYNNLWYVILKKKNEQKLKSFGVDRIQSIKVLNSDLFESDLLEIARQQCKQQIGVSDLSNNPIIITLKCKVEQWPYLLASPIHYSQKLMSKDDFNVTFMIEVIFNYEIKQSLFWYLGKVKVIEPFWVVEELKLIELPY